MQYDWIIDVLTDLRGFARENGLNSLALQLEETTLLAAAEIANKRPGAARPPAAEIVAHLAREGIGKRL